MSTRIGSRPALLCCALALFVAGPGRAEVSAVASVDRNPAREGEALTFTITVTGALTGVTEPRLPDEVRASFDVFSSGTSRQMTFTNGVTQSSITYRYEMVPKSSGDLVIPAIPITAGDQTTKTEPIHLEVSARGTRPPPSGARRDPSGGEEESAVSDVVRLIASVDETEVVEGEEILLTITFLHRVRLIDRPEFEPPSFSGFVQERLPDGPLREEVRDGVLYNVQELRYALFPLGRGEKTIGSARVVATVPRRGRRDAFSVFGSWFDGREMVVTSDPITVRVAPLPSTDDPAFSGAVGTFSMKATIDSDDVSQNEPVTLTIRISGVGNLGTMGEMTAAVSERFRVFDASSETENKVVGDRLGGVRTIQRAFVPLEAGDQEIPRVRFTYFDPGAGAYRTHTAGPFPVHVRAAASSGSAPLIVGKNEVQRLQDDVRFIRTSLTDLRRVGERTPSVAYAIHLLPLALVGGALVWRRRQDRLATDVAYSRARRAAARARRTLRDGSIDGAGRAAVWSAVGGYVADCLNAPESVLTATEAARRLEPIDAELAGRVRAFGERCDFARYAPSDATSDPARLQSDAEAILGELEGAMRTSHRGGSLG